MKNRNLRNLETESSESLRNLTLEKRLRLLEILKPLRDCEKGKCPNPRGFSSARILNKNRAKHIYTIAENLVKEYLEGHGFSSGHGFTHELPISVKDSLGKNRHFHIDFYLVSQKIGIEVNPNFHKFFSIVRVRDALKSRLLRTHNHIRTFSVSVKYKRKNGILETEIDRKALARVLRIARGLTISKETLDYYLGQTVETIKLCEVKNQ
jgi:hypothetical protein